MVNAFRVRWPAQKSTGALMRKLEKNPELWGRPISDEAPWTDVVKRDLCAQFIIYKIENGLTQRQLARKLEINEALVSKILRYWFDEFTIDRLLRYLEKLEMRFELRRVS